MKNTWFGYHPAMMQDKFGFLLANFILGEWDEPFVFLPKLSKPSLQIWRDNKDGKWSCIKKHNCVGSMALLWTFA